MADDSPAKVVGEPGVADASASKERHVDRLVDDDPLVVWALATFHTTLLVVVLVAALHVSGPLGDLLGGLSTIVGFALFLILWASTWWATGRTLAAVSTEETTTFEMVTTGGKWGGVNGVCFLWAILLVAVVPAVGLERGALPAVALVAAIGSVLALGIGGIVGVLFAAVDVVAFRAAAKLSPN